MDVKAFKLYKILLFTLDCCIIHNIIYAESMRIF